MDDIFSALKLDPRTAVPEIRSLKPEAQALITQGLSSRCRALLSQLPDARARLSDGDIQGVLAAGEALIQIDAGQPSWYILLADVLTATGRHGLCGVSLPWVCVGSVVSVPAPLTPGVSFVKPENEALGSVAPKVSSARNPSSRDLVPA